MIIIGGVTTTSLAQLFDIITEKNISLYDYIIGFTPSKQSKEVSGSVGGARDSVLVEALNSDWTGPGDSKYFYFLTPVQNASTLPIIKDVDDEPPKKTAPPALQSPSVPPKPPIKKSDPEPTVTKNTSLSAPLITQEKHYLYPQASSRLLSNSELAGLTSEQLKMMRNEIYARHSYIFTSEKMRNYFAGKAWYTPLHRNVSDKLTPIENHNIILIKQTEKQGKTSVMSSDK